MRSHMKQNVIKFWLIEKNVDGIRVDALANLVEDQEFRDEPIKDDPSVNLKVIRVNSLLVKF
jgi:glycosidase